MGENDVSEKYLESFNDVFADIFNVLLFKKKLISEEQLRNGAVETIYKTTEGKARSQIRDVVKECEAGNLIIACMGIENQSTIDKHMPVRIMGYDYGSYRHMLENGEECVPALTVVLNFGQKIWKSPLGLKDMLIIPEELEPFVQDYRIHVFNVAFLPREIRNQFTSDFKIVADFFAEKNRENYEPSKETIQHVEAVLEMLRVFTNDPTYARIKSEVLQWSREGRAISMCTFADRMTNLGLEQGIAQERERSEKLLAEKDKFLRQKVRELEEKDAIIQELKLQLAAMG